MKFSTEKIKEVESRKGIDEARNKALDFQIVYLKGWLRHLQEPQIDFSKFNIDDLKIQVQDASRVGL